MYEFQTKRWHTGSAEILSDARSHLKFLGIRMVRKSKRYTAGPQILEVTLQNLA
jgi:hypothetical protein